MPSDLEMVEKLPFLPARAAHSNKGDFGRVLVVAGSRGMSGAAILCGSAALRGGAGLVRIALPQDILPLVAAGNPCYMTAPLPQDDDGRLNLAARDRLFTLVRANDVVALGPGLGRSTDLTQLLADLLRQCAVPLVLDADGLNALVDDLEPLRNHAGPVIITPHPGEFSRLLRLNTASVQQERQELAVRFAREFKLVVVLKGHGTIVTDGQRVYRNTTGNPGMATGGTGDVLTGLVAALWGQGLDAFQAAQLGVYVHGLAGDLARSDLGELGLIATDLLAYLPRALQTLS
jgi:ADP-dependent NAD(P)H-hydrate dehydratase